MPQSPYQSSGDSPASQVRDELKQDAEHLRETVADRGKHEAESRKDEAAHAAGAASSALEAAADDLESNPDAPDWMSSALQQAARKIEGVASQIEGRSIDDIASRVTRFARENPGSFLAASAAAGFAAARVMRAGVDRQRHDHHEGGDRRDGAHYDPHHLHAEVGTPREMTRDIAPGYNDIDNNVGGGVR